MIDIITVVNGILEENCYIIHNGRDALIVDPGSEGNKIIDAVKASNLKVIGILITHSHFDHIGALEDVKKEYPDAVIINNKNKGDQSIGMFKFKVIENPGHTEDSVSYYFDNNDILFSGDFIFKGTIGNYPDGMEDDMVKSLNVFKYMSSNVSVYPGHGPSTTVKDEIENNPFLRGI
jgi:glyoxylase-like metal-dependent hydrolase (beta-lactamase superfamily II)